MFLFELSTKIFLPVIFLLFISVIVQIILRTFKIKFIPAFVIELIIGIIIAKPFNEFISQNAFTPLVDGVYVLGLSLIMFLSGYDVDAFRIKKKALKFHNLKWSLIILVLVYVMGFGLSWIFVEGENKLSQAILVTLVITSVFAGLVVPLVQSTGVINSKVGQFISTFASISELLSILFLSIYMVIIDISSGNWYFGVIMFAIIIIVLVIDSKIGFTKVSEFLEENVFEHLPARILVAMVLLMVYLSDLSGGEYILGAFLFGFLIRELGIFKKVIDTFDDLVYGIFSPIFYILVGTKIDITLFSNQDMVFIVVGLVLAILLARLPIFLLLKYYSFKALLPAVLISTSTIIVAIAASHIGLSINLFSVEFSEALILSSVITCIIPPVIFELFVLFGGFKEKVDNKENSYETN